ncbi:MAG: hypothetical protein IKB98_07500, partial [Clostridia bacterium]|nr:hypothetical protein [Clostridia bacterium]
KRLLAILLCALMAISVVACGGGSDNDGDNTGNGGTNQDTPANPDDGGNTPSNPDDGGNTPSNPDDGGNNNPGGGSGDVGTDPDTPVDPDDNVDPNAEPVEIYIQGYEAGVNLNWIRTLSDEFAQINANRSFVPGTRGVKFKIEGVSSTDSSSMQNANIHFYVMHGNFGADTARNLAAQEKVVSIDDVVSVQDDIRYDENEEPYLVSIREKVLPRFYNESLCYGGESSDQNIEAWYKEKYNLPDTFKWGTCYGLPSYGITTGLSFDAYNFNYYGLFLADPAWVAANPDGEGTLYNTYTCKFGTAVFVNGSGEGNLLEGAVKACGNDGLYNTWDDGQPTSMVELFILCDYMKNVHQIAPLSSYGKSHSKRQEMVNNLWSSLGGFDAAQSMFTYTSNGNAVKVVTGFENTSAFDGVSYISKPVTEEVVITPENGYLAYQTEARYYGISWLQIAYEEGWYSTISGDSNISHLDCEDKFILNGLNGNPLLGMLIEGNYWYNEARKNGSEDRFRNAARYDRPGVTEPDIQWMALPTKVTGTVTPNEDGIANPVNLEQGTYGSAAPIVINAKYKNDANIIKLLKEFMAYLHTDDALSFYSGDQGVYRKSMDYGVKPEDRQRLSAFQKSFMDAYETRCATLEPVQYSGLFPGKSITYADGQTYYASYQNGAHAASTNAKKLFQDQWISADLWASADYRAIWSTLY